MAEQIAHVLERRFQIPQDRAVVVLRRILVGLAAAVFVLVATLFVAFDKVFTGFNDIATLEVGDIAPRDIVAPPNAPEYVSEILSEQARASARSAVQPVYDPPDPNVARQQRLLAQQILDYVEDVRADIYGTREQRIADLMAIRAINLDENIAQTVLQFDDETWNTVDAGILNVLSDLMRQEIRLGQEQNFRAQLDNRASGFNLRERRVIVDFVDDLIYPNTFENVEETSTAQDAAAEAVQDQTRTFTAGQIILREGEPVDALAYEGLVAMNLLQNGESQAPEVLRALIASSVTMVIIGLYMARFDQHLLYHETRKLALTAGLFLITLGAARFLGIQGDIFLFPSAALSLLYVTIVGPHVAIITSLGLGLLIGIMANNSLQIAALVTAGGVIGALSLRRVERLPAFFVTGALIGTVNAAIVAIFNLAKPTVAVGNVDFASELVETFFSGLILVPLAAIGAMFAVTFLFNLPTTLKLLDLSQPSKPLLQRLLRESPGTYQHSLQVANLAEQAANAIGGDAQLTHVAALYHDIGKMLNPLYFTENQQDIGNPHDTLNDPYRSADIIIGHVTEGDELAKQYHLPQRIRDFIREHHGTTQVYVFYQKALQQVDGDESAVEITDFTYPGPRPRSKETAILMLADSCEAAVRSVKPQSKQQILDLVNNIIEQKRSTGQLDDSYLTLNDLRTIREIFVEILQGMFHPRINYREAVGKKTEAAKPLTKPKPAPAVAETSNGTASAKSAEPAPRKTPPQPIKPAADPAPKVAPAPAPVVEDDEVVEEAPLTEVPRLPSLDERRNNPGEKKKKDATANGSAVKEDPQKEDSEKA